MKSQLHQQVGRAFMWFAKIERSTGALYSALAGNMGAVVVGGVVAAVFTLIKPDNQFNWESTRALNNADRFIPQAVLRAVPPPTVAALDDNEKFGEGDTPEEPSQTRSTMQQLPLVESPYDLAKGMERVMSSRRDAHTFVIPAFRFATFSSIGLTLILVLVSFL